MTSRDYWRYAGIVLVTVVLGPPISALAFLFSFGWLSAGARGVQAMQSGVWFYVFGSYIVGLPAVILSGVLSAFVCHKLEQGAGRLPQWFARSRLVSGGLVGMVCGLVATFIYMFPEGWLIVVCGSFAGAICGAIGYLIFARPAVSS